jgi:hypothetical protein
VTAPFEADPLPYAAEFGGGFAMLLFGQFAAVGRSGLARHRDTVLGEAPDAWGRSSVPTLRNSGQTSIINTRPADGTAVRLIVPLRKQP